MKVGGSWFLMLIILWLALLVRSVYSINCPSYCQCHMQDNYRYISCVKQGFNSLDLDFHTTVEWLQLSNNFISTLPNFVFMQSKLFDLKRLELDNNAIITIESLAFNGVYKLETLDLSSNRLYELAQNTFSSIKTLTALDVSNNPFTYFPEPFLISSSVEILLLRRCNLGNITKLFLSELPSLKVVDLSNNHLVKLFPSVIQHHPYLSEIQLSGNPLRCYENEAGILIKTMRERGIRVSGLNCPILQDNSSNPKQKDDTPIENSQDLSESTTVTDFDYNTSASFKTSSMNSWDTGFKDKEFSFAGWMILIIILGIVFLLGVMLTCICVVLHLLFCKYSKRHNQTRVAYFYQTRYPNEADNFLQL